MVHGVIIPPELSVTRAKDDTQLAGQLLIASLPVAPMNVDIGYELTHFQGIAGIDADEDKSS
jgi:hypothetical protein